MKSKVSTPCPAPEQEKRHLPGDPQGWSLLCLLFLTHSEPTGLFS